MTHTVYVLHPRWKCVDCHGKEAQRPGKIPAHLTTASPRAEPRDQSREAVVEGQFSTSWANFTTSAALIPASRHLRTSSSGIV